ncbi:MAG: M48 family metalloprotease [Rhodospirillales bacterium]|nr:M48 family metalloprotease [Rhodospirillales bacterium]
MLKSIFLPLAPVVLYVVILFWPESALSANTISLVRDAETENIIESYAKPLFKAAGLDPDAVRIHLVMNPKLNAFVSGGQNIFIHTGLLSTAKQVGQVIGVIAHETGHIAGGHLLRSAQAIDNAKTMDLITTLIGVGAGILAGRSDIATASTAGNPQLGIRSFLKFSRTQESSADHAALRILEDTGQSARGLSEFMKLIENQELLSASRQDPYLLTHPLSRERVATIEEHLRKSTYTDTPYPEALQIQHERIRAKIIAFSSPLAIVLQHYPESDDSVWARYARAFAYYRLPDLKKAVILIDELLTDYPDDPYFYELKAQMLFEHGHVLDAIANYQRAVDLAPPSDVLYLELGQAQLASERENLLESAEKNLQSSLKLKRNSSFAWRQLAIAYGRQNKMGRYHLALAEEALLKKHIDEALKHAEHAEPLFKKDTKEWLHAQDIAAAAKAIK